MTEIKAIPTYYNGYKFRSRIEARWAVLMDLLEIKYDYEPEGFTKDGIYYLPDFWLSQYEIFLEIKNPLELEISQDEIKKIEMCAWHKAPVLVENNLPTDFSIDGSLYITSSDDSGGGASIMRSQILSFNNKFLIVGDWAHKNDRDFFYNFDWLQFPNKFFYYNDPFLPINEWDYHSKEHFNSIDELFYYYDNSMCRLNVACNEAKTHRFGDNNNS